MTESSGTEKLSGPDAGLSATGATTPGDAEHSDYGDAGGNGTADEEEAGAEETGD